MNRDNIDFISEALSEMFSELQTTIEHYSLDQLTRYTDDLATWKKMQNKHFNEYKKAINKLFKEFSSRIEAPINKAFSEVIKDAKEDLKDITNKSLPKPDDTLKNAFSLQVGIELSKLQKQSLIGFRKVVDDISGKITYKKKVFSGDELFKTINHAYDVGVEKMGKVVYRNKRKVSYKAYMEMNVRTTMQQEALQYQFDTAKSLGVIFYICSYHGDCAPDHAPYQGKIYVDKDWQSMIPKDLISKVGEFIASKEMMFIQDVRDVKPFLTTRPNCRHTFRPITIDQAMNTSVDDLLNKLKMKKGSYDANKYKNLQEQRRLERQVRKAKEERDKVEIALSNEKDPKVKQALKQDLAYRKSIVTRNQRAVNNLVKDNRYLERDYRRENYKTIVQDAGAKYNRDKK